MTPLRLVPAAGAVFLAATTLAFAADPAAPPSPVRIARVEAGHIHPSLAVTRTGVLLTIFSAGGGGGRNLLLSRSRDGGRTWSEPRAIPGITDCSIYPGSLSVLGDGRLLLNWSCYRPEYRVKRNGTEYREPHYSLSADEGETWSAPRTYPLDRLSLYTCLRNPIAELPDGGWILPFYDRTVVFYPDRGRIAPLGDARNHGMVPLIRTRTGALVSGTPEADAPVPGGRARNPVGGLRSINDGRTWQPLQAMPRFGVAGYDLTALRNGLILLTTPDYGGEAEGETGIRLIVSADDGRTWRHDRSVIIHAPGRRIKGRGWPRTVQVDDTLLATVFFDLDPQLPGGPGLFVIRTPLAALAAPI